MSSYFFSFFSLLRLSLISFISFSSMTLTLCSTAQSAHPFNTSFKNGRGTLTSIFKAASVNFTSVFNLSAAYLTEEMSTSRFGIAIGSGFLKPEHQKYLLSLYPQFVGSGQ